MQKLRDLFCKYREQILYLFFGGLTTVVNFIVFFILNKLISGSFALTIATWAAWLVSVLFAYFTNRKWVFKSNVSSKKGVFQEIASFFGARLFSGVLDYLIMLLTVSILGWNENIMKIISNIFVIIINYFFSKLIIFKTKKDAS